jgi:1-acyl-sn-glycerol-3-phosphate acyltransferase
MTNHELIMYALIGVPSLFLAYTLYGIGFWIYQGRKLQKTGYMPPPSSKFARWFYKRSCHLIAWLKVGPIKVIGRENARFDGRGLVLPNHQFAMDFAAVGVATPFSYRQIAKAKELRGIRGPLAAWVGTVGVQVEGGKAQDGKSNTVIDTAKDILAHSHGARLLLFAQGKLVWDNILRKEDFRTGATRILQATIAEIGQDPIYVLPMAIHYKRDPKDATRLHRFLSAIGVKSFRRFKDYELVDNGDGTKTKKDRIYTTYGAVVVVGKPIDARTLSADPREAIESIRVVIQGLLEQAQAAA